MTVELFALVEKRNVDPVAAIQQPVIVRIIRTYEGRPRAEEDIDLLRSTVTQSSFEIVAVEHIDS